MQEDQIIQRLYELLCEAATEHFQQETRSWQELDQEEQARIKHNMHILAYAFAEKNAMPGTNFEELLVELLLLIPRNIIPLPKREPDERS